MLEGPATEQNVLTRESRQAPRNLSQSTENSLREEIRGTQVAQSDIIKWKFIAIAAVGAFSFHLPLSDAVNQIAKSQEGFNVELSILALVPLLCLYSDMICLHYILRVITVGAFIKSSYQERRAEVPTKLLDYEGFVFAARGQDTLKSPLALELVAVVGSSLLIDFSLLVISTVSWFRSHAADSRLQEYVLGALSLFGLLATLSVFSQYRKRIGVLQAATVNLDGTARASQ